MADNISDNTDNRYYQRLDRIEEKIDKLSDAVIAIARAEERIVAIEADKQDYWQRLNNHAKKIDEYDVSITKLISAVDVLERINNRDREEIQARLKDQGQRLGDLEQIVSEVKRTTSVIHRLAWSGVALALAYVFNQVGNFF